MNSTVDDVQATDEPNGGVTVRKLSEMHGGVTRGLLNIVLIVLSTTVAFGVAEVYFRVFNLQSIVPGYVEVSEFGIRKNIGHVQGVMSTAEFRHGFTTKSQGFRDQAEYAPVKPPDVTELLVRAVHRTTSERGVPLVVLNIPVIHKGQVIQNFPKDAIGLEDSSVVVLDVQKTVYDRHPLSELSYAEDSHPKPMAHRLIGEALARVIQTELWTTNTGSLK